MARELKKLPGSEWGVAMPSMISEEEFEGWQETVHLLSSPRNAERIFRAIRQLNAGNGRERIIK